MNGLEAVQTLGHENEVRMQSGNLFQAGADRTADFGFFLGIGRVIAIVGVADEAILEAERVDGFRQTRRERNDASNRLRNTDGAAGFVNDFAEKRGGGGGCRRNGLCAQMHGCGQQSSNHDADCESEARTCNHFQEFPRQRNFRGITKKPHETPRGFAAALLLAKSAGLCGIGGWPGLRLFSRLQWRDRGRFARPSPLPLPAKMKDECMPAVGGSQFDWFRAPRGLQLARRRDFSGSARGEKAAESSPHSKAGLAIFPVGLALFYQSA